MNRTPSRPWAASLLVLLIVLSPCRSQEASRRAVLHVRLPADARLTVDGQPTKQSGLLRLFYSPPLEPGKSYHYTFEWTHRAGGKSVTSKKIVNIRAGEDKEVDLTAEEPSKRPERKNEKPADKKPPRKLDVVYVPTPPEVVEKMLELAHLKKDDVVYDLGCGDGRIVIAAAKKYKCKAVGFDLNPLRVREARENVKEAGVADLVTIEEKNLFDVDVKPASVIALYLLPELNVKLLPQLKKLKDGSRIVSHDFEIEGYPPKQTEAIRVEEDGLDHQIYLWETPLKKAR